MKTSVKNLVPLFMVFAVLLFTACQSEIDKKQNEFKTFLNDYGTKYESLLKEYNTASFNAAVSGNEDEYKKAEQFKIAITKLQSSKETFEKLKKYKEANDFTDSTLRNALDIVYYQFLMNQVDEQKAIDIIVLENSILRKFSTFRPVLNEKEISDNEIENVLKTSTDSKELENYWRASKKVGREIDDEMIELVKKRNEVAKELGFHNFWEMSLIANGQNPEEIDSIFTELDLLTRGPYIQLKQEVDEFLANKYNVLPENLMPWHYQNRFFQEAPNMYNADLDKFYNDKDLIGIANTYFESIGLNINDVLSNSDLISKKGKTQGAYTTDINRNGDIRVVANIENNEYSMYTLLYEGGFASYYKNIDREYNVALRQPPNFMCIDAVGNLFGRFASDIHWMKIALNIPQEEFDKLHNDAVKKLRLKKFVFSRWAQVMYRFEKEMYEDPNQNLNELWWQLVKRYQFVNPPELRNEPDWAAKQHLITMPCTYFNYALGDLYAAQLYNYIVYNVLKTEPKNADFINNAEIGNYLIKNVFEPGATMNWNRLIIYSTKEKLTADYFVNQFVRMQ